MSHLRYHLWSRDGLSLCELRRVDQASTPEATDQPTVCGPCLVAVDVLRRQLIEMLLDAPYPLQTPEEAAEELLDGPFKQGRDAAAITRFIHESGYSYPTFAGKS